MTRPPLLRSVLLLAAATALLGGCGSEEASRRPNLVVIVVDTLRGDARFPDDVLRASEGLTSLSRDAVRFPRAFSHAPMTLPSHAALLSSRPPFEVMTTW